MNKEAKASIWQEILQRIRNIPLILRYGLILSLGLVLVKTLEYQLFSYRFSMELYTGLLAVFFLLVGIATGLGWLQTRKVKMDKPDIKRSSETVIEEPLTAKERTILQGLLAGMSNQQIADSQHVSVNTIKTHLKNLYRKLSVANRAEAVAKAQDLGFENRPVQVK
ncbi:response regulator transcription factor [Aliiglaciecola sp. M165]|uniref:response regulator transcription factor n=1 Tax=Aliiglaciecola sp. M165 TaxID=2593649 RepID=UPI00118064BE|nr:helix-turn-helix transcriptional regulator [Aliiglaciecola sp. M165]TRY31818.1 helix-turn-helix transcriptional regulator [Aliiglaciecola sp. M165]